MAFATLTLARLFHGFNCRSESSIFKIGIKSNLWSVAAFVIGTLMLGFVIFVKFMHSMFMIAPLTGIQIIEIIALAFVPTVIIQVVKVVVGKNKIKQLFNFLIFLIWKGDSLFSNVKSKFSKKSMKN